MDKWFVFLYHAHASTHRQGNSKRSITSQQWFSKCVSVARLRTKDCLHAQNKTVFLAYLSTSSDSISLTCVLSLSVKPFFITSAIMLSIVEWFSSVRNPNWLSFLYIGTYTIRPLTLWIQLMTMINLENYWNTNSHNTDVMCVNWWRCWIANRLFFLPN